jgi:hypothetical protein
MERRQIMTGQHASLQASLHHGEGPINMSRHSKGGRDDGGHKVNNGQWKLLYDEQDH